MIYGYARVSSKTQQRDGNSLEEQRKQLTQLGAQEIIEECYTGTTVQRPKFNELIKKLDSGDTLVVTKFDRFARTASEGAALIKSLVDKGITVNIVNMGIAQNTPTGKLMIQILLAFAEYERDMIVERTQAGKAVAKCDLISVKADLANSQSNKSTTPFSSSALILISRSLK